MNLEQKYIRQLQAKPKYAKYISLHWADYIELLCLANLDGVVSIQDVIDRLSERERDLEEGDQTEIQELKSFEGEDADGQATRRAEIPDRWKTSVEDWFKVLEVRASTYGDAYPFIVGEKEIVMKDDLKNLRKIYVYLLLCSNLRLLDKASRNVLANCFELMSSDVLKSILPNANVYLFGSNPYNKEGRYSSDLSLWDRTNKLADDLREQINPRIDKRKYPQTNRGDAGLDIVAWIPSGDSLPSMPVFFCQCACTTEWISKQGDSSYNSWANRINFTNRPNNIVFIPFCYRGVDGHWFDIADIRMSFLIDRKRILHLLGAAYDKFDEMPVAEIVQKIVDTKEDVV